MNGEFNGNGMNPEVPPGDATSNAELERVLDAYLAAAEAGRPVDPEQLLADHPDLSGPLRACLRILRLANGIASAADADATTSGTGGSRSPSSRNVVTALWTSNEPAPHVLLRDLPVPEGPPVRARAGWNRTLDGLGPERYQILGEIGRGGMGAVLQGRDPDLGRDLAIKVLLKARRHDPDALRRFIEEAQIGGQLQHPGIVPIYELGAFAEGRPYFAMKLVRGRTLAALLRGRSDPADDLSRFLAIFEHVAQTVAYAHARGVIHRDLKPSNVMVGSFGEVQVMDWGLAKVLPRGGAAPTTDPGSGDGPVTTVRSGPDSDASQAGSAIGTPAYMAPEQARGETDSLDERCDVFGLGAILGEILTGLPPYSQGPGREVLEMARRGETSGALARLDACGADEVLRSLARSCLSADPADRPRDAGEVAGAIASYRASVQEKLRRAELARVEERARRRLTTGMAAAAVLFVMAVGGGLAWSVSQHADRVMRTARVVNEALGQADLLAGEAGHERNDPSKWSDALEAAERAHALLNEGEADEVLRRQVKTRVAELRARRDAAEADRRLLSGLEAARGSFAESVDWKRSDAAYASAFRAAGLDLDATDPETAGAWIRQRTAPGELTTYLDDWAYVCRLAGRPDAAGRLIAAARAADNDAWRNSLRAKFATRDEAAAATFRALADNLQELDAQPAASLVLLAEHLHDGVGDRQRAEAVLRRAWRRFPDDFWVNFRLAMAPGQSVGRVSTIFPHPAEAVRYLTAAVAIRPGSPQAHTNLGAALEASGDLEGAIAEHREAIRLKPDHAGAHCNLGSALYASGDLKGSLAHLRKAIRLEPNLATPHYNLGRSLIDAGARTGAVAELREAIRLKPDHAQAHCNLGSALADEGDLEGAIEAYREAIRLDPNYTLARSNLGLALKKSGNLARAEEELRTAIRLDPEQAEVHRRLGNVLHESGDLAGAIEEYRETIRLKPDHVEAHNDLGVALRLSGDLAGAVKELREAMRLEPDFAAAYTNLGVTLAISGDLPAALVALRKATRLKPESPDAHYNLGMALDRSGDLVGAIEAYREAIRQRPDFAEAHCNLGHTLRKQRRYAEALAELRTGGELGSKRHGWKYPSAQWVAEAERLAHLFDHLPDYLTGVAEPADAAERLVLARMAHDTKHFAGAARLWGEALEAQPRVAGDRRAQHRYNAACSAALAAAGQGENEPKPDDEAREDLRRQALDWLRAELTTWSKVADLPDPRARAFVARSLHHWQADPDLVSIRDPSSLAILPEEERSAWTALWADVAQLLTRAEDRPAEAAVQTHPILPELPDNLFAPP